MNKNVLTMNKKYLMKGMAAFATLDVKIHVTNSTGSVDETIKYVDENISPYAVMVPTAWRWPTERTCISKAYPGTADFDLVDGTSFRENSFDAWASTHNRTAAMESWYEYPVEAKTKYVAPVAAEE